MDAKILKGLNGSIKKWKKIVAGTGVDMGVSNCPLCQLFLEGKDQSCQNCPIAQKIKTSGCNNSPYEEWVNHQRKEKSIPWGSLKIECSTCKKLAQAELQFLKSLLPKKQIKEKAINKIMEQRKKAKEKLISPKRIPK